MVIMTAKVPKRRILLVVLLLLAAAVVLALCLGGAKHGGEKPQRTDAKGGTNEARIAFLAEYGWEVSAEPVQTQQVRVPEEPGEVFLRYNELQVSQGYDLLQYSGQELTRYVYQVTNYPDSSGTYYATLLVKDGQIVGADIASSAKKRGDARAEDAGIKAERLPFQGPIPPISGKCPEGTKGVGMLSPKVTERLPQI